MKTIYKKSHITQVDAKGKKCLRYRKDLIKTKSLTCSALSLQRAF